ncbi:hypothetical protein COOONC_10139, partial [Cooperia oncophora]
MDVNWTEYFLLVAPPESHSYILANPSVVVPSMEYIAQINQLFNDASSRTLTNYVIVQYILSWMRVLDNKYLSLFQ